MDYLSGMQQVAELIQDRRLNRARALLHDIIRQYPQAERPRLILEKLGEGAAGPARTPSHAAPATQPTIQPGTNRARRRASGGTPRLQPESPSAIRGVRLPKLVPLQPEEPPLGSRRYWVAGEHGVATIGISPNYVSEELGDVVFVELPEVGAYVSPNRASGLVESTKTTLEIRPPVSGTVVAVNRELIERPELVNEDPTGDGWLMQINTLAIPPRV